MQRGRRNIIRICVLGSTGLLGHKVVQILSPEFEVIAAQRTGLPGAPVFSGENVKSIVIGDVSDLPNAWSMLFDAQPDVVINCLGVVKQSPEAEDIQVQTKVNGLFPHELAQACEANGARLIHVSTDCVFSGSRGMYVESDTPDPVDAYGMTKLLGEPLSDMSLVLRTSFVGPEAPGSRFRNGFLHWLQTSPPRVQGYSNAFFSGLPTVSLARLLQELILDFPDLTGLYHCASKRISKFDLAVLLAQRLDLGKIVSPVDEPHLDRSLDPKAFERATGIAPRDWNDLSSELAEDFFESSNW